jgi:glucan biosynthesis protein
MEKGSYQTIKVFHEFFYLTAPIRCFTVAVTLMKEKTFKNNYFGISFSHEWYSHLKKKP